VLIRIKKNGLFNWIPGCWHLNCSAYWMEETYELYNELHASVQLIVCMITYKMFNSVYMLSCVQSVEQLICYHAYNQLKSVYVSIRTISWTVYMLSCVQEETYELYNELHASVQLIVCMITYKMFNWWYAVYELFNWLYA
jgi:hypothetical protein